MYSLDLSTNVERREREREKENQKAGTIKQSSTWKRATDSKLEQGGRKNKFKEASHLSLYHPFVISYGNFQNSEIALHRHFNRFRYL